MVKDIKKTQFRKVGEEPNREKWHIVMVGERRNAQEPETVFINVNGDALRIRRGLPIPLQNRFVEVLKNAVEPVHKTEEDKDGRVVSVKTGLVNRYPYSILFRDIPEKVALALAARTRGGEELTEEGIEKALNDYGAEEEKGAGGE